MDPLDHDGSRMAHILTVQDDLNHPQYGDTPLHWAAFYGYTDCATILMEAGARTDIKNGVGNSQCNVLALNYSAYHIRRR